MAYRKIEVNDVTYEYVVGRDSIKIKGLGVFNKEAMFGDNFAVTPQIIKELIIDNV